MLSLEVVQTCTVPHVPASSLGNRQVLELTFHHDSENNMSSDSVHRLTAVILSLSSGNVPLSNDSVGRVVMFAFTAPFKVRRQCETRPGIVLIACLLLMSKGFPCLHRMAMESFCLASPRAAQLSQVPTIVGIPADTRFIHRALPAKVQP